MKLYEKRVSNARCYTTTTYYLFGRRIRQVKVYKGGKAPRAPKSPVE